MTRKLTKCLTAGALAVTLVIPPSALAFHGGGGGFGGGMHGGFGGGMHAMGGGGMHFGGMGGGPRFSHVAFQPGFFHRGFFHRPFFHRRFHQFAFFGAPYVYANYGYYDGCWRRVWTGYGVQWVNVCYDYGY